MSGLHRKMNWNSVKSWWYRIVIILFACIFSLICWESFTKWAGGQVKSHFSNSKSIATINTTAVDDDYSDTAETLSQSPTNKAQNHFAKMLENFTRKIVDNTDKYVNIVNDKWYEGIFKCAQLSKADSLYSYFLTGEISSQKVIKGTHGWLFYKGDSSVADYEGTNDYSQSEMDNMLKEALSFQDKLSEAGTKCAILVCPNKENIYSEYMPEQYIHREFSSKDILVDYLSANGVNIINPKKELLQLHQDFQLYYSCDTHWNQLGGYIGVKSVLKSWNIETPELAKRSITSHELKDNYHVSALNDMAQITGLRELVYNDDLEYIIEGTGAVDWEQFAEEQNSENHTSYYHNPNASINASILLVGDSFRVGMVPALMETFSDVYVRPRGYSITELLEEVSPDYCIMEYVERYAGSISEINSRQLN